MGIVLASWIRRHWRDPLVYALALFCMYVLFWCVSLEQVPDGQAGLVWIFGLPLVVCAEGSMAYLWVHSPKATNRGMVVAMVLPLAIMILSFIPMTSALIHAPVTHLYIAIYEEPPGGAQEQYDNVKPDALDGPNAHTNDFCYGPIVLDLVDTSPQPLPKRYVDPVSCASLESLHADAPWQRMKLKIINNTPRRKHMVEVDSAGAHLDRGELAPGQIYRREVEAGQIWSVEDESRVCLSAFKVKRLPCHYPM